MIFFDNNMSPELCAFLRHAGRDVCHIRDTPGFHRDMADEAWIPLVGRRGWAVITKDVNIHRTQSTRDLMRSHRVVGLFLHRSLAGIWPEAREVIRRWETIERKLAEGQHSYRMGKNGGLSRWK